VSALLIKILLAVFACVIAILGVSDLKTVRDNGMLAPRPWWRRITCAGKVKMVCAIATLFLIGLNEYWSYTSAKVAKEQADAEAKNLQSRLDRADRDMLANIQKITELSRTNGYLVTTLDFSLVRAGAARVSWEDIASPQVKLHFENGQSVIPKAGDVVEWVISCEDGRLPALPTTATCAQSGYGRLMADAAPVVLDEKSGRRTFFGTRSTNATMTYRSAAENNYCPETAEALKASHCDLELTIMREARWKFEQLGTEHNGAGDVSIPDDAQDACRRYEALFGESCQQALRNTRAH
jgi:hypothetical protein